MVNKKIQEKYKNSTVQKIGVSNIYLFIYLGNISMLLMSNNTLNYYKYIYNVTKYMFQINVVLLNFLFIKESWIINKQANKQTNHLWFLVRIERIHTFIQKGCIKLIKSISKYMHNVIKIIILFLMLFFWTFEFWTPKKNKKTLFSQKYSW